MTQTSGRLILGFYIDWVQQTTHFPTRYLAPLTAALISARNGCPAYSAPQHATIASQSHVPTTLHLVHAYRLPLWLAATRSSPTCVPPSSFPAGSTPSLFPTVASSSLSRQLLHYTSGSVTHPMSFPSHHGGSFPPWRPPPHQCPPPPGAPNARKSSGHGTHSRGSLSPPYIAIVCLIRFKGMLQLNHMDVAKLKRGCCSCSNF